MNKSLAYTGSSLRDLFPPKVRPLSSRRVKGCEKDNNYLFFKLKKQQQQQQKQVAYSDMKKEVSSFIWLILQKCKYKTVSGWIPYINVRNLKMIVDTQSYVSLLTKKTKKKHL